MGSIFAGLNGNGGGFLQKLLTQGVGPGSQDDGPLARLQIPNLPQLQQGEIPNGGLISAMQMPQTAMPTPQYEQGPGAVSQVMAGLQASQAGQPQEPQQPMQAPGLLQGGSPQAQRFQMPQVGNSFRGGLFGGSLA
jgi:hypothetical protein